MVKKFMAEIIVMSLICSNFAAEIVHKLIKAVRFKIMAIPIRIIPTLHGKEAEAFEKAAREAEAHPGKYDLTEAAKAIKKYLVTVNF